MALSKMKLSKKKLENIIENKKLPIIPAYVFFGLNLVSLGPLIIFPTTYPPKSVEIHINNINKKYE